VLQAFERYGRHRYPVNDRNSALNLADCFHYASATSRGASILTKDTGFALTDLEIIDTTKNQ
jgi:ribonuclease VapC